MDDELLELIDWYESNQINEVRIQQILTYGTDSDRILLELFVRFGRIVANVHPPLGING